VRKQTRLRLVPRIPVLDDWTGTIPAACTKALSAPAHRNATIFLPRCTSARSLVSRLNRSLNPAIAFVTASGPQDLDEAVDPHPGVGPAESSGSAWSPSKISTGDRVAP
jgi:hypothetical protein